MYNFLLKYNFLKKIDKIILFSLGATLTTALTVHFIDRYRRKKILSLYIMMIYGGKKLYGSFKFIIS